MTLRDFGSTELWFLIFSARWTVFLSLVAFVGGGALGAGWWRRCGWRHRAVLRRAAAIWIRALQGTPLLVQLLIVYYGTAFIGLRPDAWLAASITFVVSTSAFFGEIWRGCIEAIPSGQWDGARALGFRFPAILRLVILPQALRLMIAPTIGYMVQIIKSTSVASLIGIAELTRTAVLVNTVTFEPVSVFGVVSLTYFVMCWPLSLLAERFWRGGSTRAAAAASSRCSVRSEPGARRHRIASGNSPEHSNAATGEDADDRNRIPRARIVGSDFAAHRCRSARALVQCNRRGRAEPPKTLRAKSCRPTSRCSTRW